MLQSNTSNFMNALHLHHNNACTSLFLQTSNICTKGNQEIVFLLGHLFVLPIVVRNPADFKEGLVSSLRPLLLPHSRQSSIILVGTYFVVQYVPRYPSSNSNKYTSHHHCGHDGKHQIGHTINRPHHRSETIQSIHFCGLTEFLDQTQVLNATAFQ